MCRLCEINEAVARPETSRRRFLQFAGGIAAGLAAGAGGLCERHKAAAEAAERDLAGRALERLMKGNERYVEGVSSRHDFKTEREALAGGQNPFAAILSCADSRIAPEYAFDSGRGDLFVCRVAGNFANDDTIASLEYGVAVLNSPLILVLGHDSCGAVDATIKSLKDNTTLPGHLPSLVTRWRRPSRRSRTSPATSSPTPSARTSWTSPRSNRRRRSSAPPQQTEDQDRRRHLSARERQGRTGRLMAVATRTERRVGRAQRNPPT